MCGIVGFYSASAPQSNTAAQLNQALHTLAHRGPDSSDAWFDLSRGVGLGHVRLSILDNSNAAMQPMTSADGRWVMVFNGEVYNFAHIRGELQSVGVAVKSSGDSEVILEAFALWGLLAVNRFVGMFAIALWDKREQSLYLIRDRVGVKPLYYSMVNGNCLFASELKGMQQFPLFRPEIDKRAAGEYLRYGYLSEQSCIYENTFKVQPGTWERISSSGQKTTHRYWSVEDKSNLSSTMRTDDDWTNHIESLLADSARLRMISDVPIGVFLSGGVDSSLVAALTQAQSSQRVKTFTIGFEDEAFNEAPFARDVARHLGTEHQEFIMPASMALDMLPKWGDLYDEPFGDSSGLPTLLVSRAAAQEVKVVLSADGGDELFSGYGRYSILEARGRRLESIPQWLRTATSRGMSLFPWQQLDDQLADYASAWTSGHKLRYSTTYRASMVARRIGLRSSAEFYDAAHAYLSDAQIERLIGARAYSRRSCGDYAGPAVEQFARWDFDHYLPGDIMTKVDRATMSASIEGREPLLDHRLIEAAFSLPLHLKRGPFGPKHLLKKILYKYVPRELVDRPKRGFAVPMHEWLRGPLRDLLHDVLAKASESQGGLFNRTEVSRLVKRFEGGDHALTTPIWLILSFELWRQRWAVR